MRRYFYALAALCDAFNADHFRWSPPLVLFWLAIGSWMLNAAIDEAITTRERSRRP